jgi:PAS domain S-box-containing protein
VVRYGTAAETPAAVVTGRIDVSRTDEHPKAGRLADDLAVTGLSFADDDLPIDVRSLDIVDDAVIVTDLDGTIIDVNDAFVRVTGYSRREAIGQSPRLLSSGYQDAEFYAELWRTITSGEVWEGELIDRRRDGQLRTYHATISPVKDTAGRVTHFVAVERDISRELDRQAAPGSAGLIHTDLIGACVYANARAAALFDVEATQLLGQGLAGVLEPDDAAQLREVVGLVAESGRSHRLDVRRQDSGGGVLHIELAPLTVPTGAVIGAVGTIEDLSEHVAVHRELERRNAFIVSVLDALPEEVAVTADDGTVLAVNRAWRAAQQQDPDDSVLATRVGEDIEAHARRGVDRGDERAAALLDELHRRRTIGDDAGGDASASVGYAVTPLAWDEGGFVLRRLPSPMVSTDD